MTFDLIQLLEQLKKFIQQENGSRFSLFLYLFIGVILGDWVLERLINYGLLPLYAYTIGSGILLISLLIWVTTRNVKIRKDKINIGIADLQIIHVSEESPLSYDQKSQLASETAQYLYSQIQEEMYQNNAIKELQLIKLPNRIQVTFENDLELAEDLGLDLLVWGVLKSVGGKYYLNYKLTFAKKIESWAFTEIVQSMNACPEVEFDLHGLTADITIFIDQLMRLSCTLSGIHYMREAKFLAAHALIQDISHRIGKEIEKIPSSPTNYLIYYLIQFAGMRNLIAMQERMSKKNITDIFQGERIKSSIQECFGSIIASLKSYFQTMHHGIVHDQQFELEFLYALGNNPDHDRYDDAVVVNAENVQSPWTQELLSGYFSMIDEDLIDAKLHYQSVLTQDHDNMVALRTLGLIEYNLKNYLLSTEYLQEYRKNNRQHIFYRHYVDTKVLKLLSLCYLRRVNLKFLYYYYKYLCGLYHNYLLGKKYIIL